MFLQRTRDMAAANLQEGQNARAPFAAEPLMQASRSWGLEESVSSPTAEGAICRQGTIGGHEGCASGALADLGPLTGSLCCVLADCGGNCEEEKTTLEQLGFSSVLSGDRLAEYRSEKILTSAHAVVVPAMAGDLAEVGGAVSLLSRVRGIPPVIVVIVVSDANSQAEEVATRANASFVVGLSLEKARAEMFQAGADDVTCLFVGEKLRPHRVLEIVQKADYMARTVCELVETRVTEQKEKADADIQSKMRRFTNSLPGTAAPFETQDKDGNLTSIGEYTLQFKIGSGNFGSVFKCHHKEHGTCAVKLISKRRALQNPSEALALEQEFNILLHLGHHPNVVRAHQVLHGQQYITVIMSYAGRLNLNKFMEANMQFTRCAVLPDKNIYAFCRQQAAAVMHLHRNLICHRDLKPENWIVCDIGQELQLTDFGLAVHLYSAAQTVKHSCGTLPFCAPEVWHSDKDGGGYNGLAADVWSLGVGYLEQLHGYKGVERLLGWRCGRPRNHEAVLAAIRSLVAHTAAVALTSKLPRIAELVLQTVLLQPGARWPIGRVVSIQGPRLGNFIGAFRRRCFT